MKSFKMALLAAAASLAVTGAACAQSVFPQLVRLSNGAVVFVVPAMTIPQPAFGTLFTEDTVPVAAMPSPFAMMRQIDAMMANARQVLDAGGSVAPDRGVMSVVIESFSDGRNTCTRRVTYAGDGSAPKVEIRATGDSCGSAGTPAAAPDITPAPARSMPRTLEVDNRARTAPFQVASAR
jgi:hypothetical protein